MPRVNVWIERTVALCHYKASVGDLCRACRREGFGGIDLLRPRSTSTASQSRARLCEWRLSSTEATTTGKNGVRYSVELGRNTRISAPLAFLARCYGQFDDLSVRRVLYKGFNTIGAAMSTTLGRAQFSKSFCLLCNYSSTGGALHCPFLVVTLSQSI